MSEAKKSENMGFIEFVKTLNIKQEYEKVMGTFLEKVNNTYKGYVKDPDSSPEPDLFRTKPLIEYMNKNLLEHVRDIMEACVLSETNTTEAMHDDVKDVITSCVSGLESLGTVDYDGAYWDYSSSSYDYEDYIWGIINAVGVWFWKSCLPNLSILCTDGTVLKEDDKVWDWGTCILGIVKILTRIAIVMEVYGKDGYFLAHSSTPYENILLRFVLKNMKDILGFRVFYIGYNDVEIEEREVGGVTYEYGDTYDECFTQALLNLPVECEPSDEVLDDMRRDKYILAIKGTPADTDVDELFKLNKALFYYCRKELV